MYRRCTLEKAVPMQKKYEHCLLKLMKEKSYDEIAINDICQRMGASTIFPAGTDSPNRSRCSHFSPRTRSRLFKVIAVERLFPFLRYTFAMLALQNGMDVKTLSGLLGDCSAGFTQDTYGYISTGNIFEKAKFHASERKAAIWISEKVPVRVKSRSKSGFIF